MIVLYILLGLLVLLLLPVTIRLRYTEQEGFRAVLRYVGIPLWKMDRDTPPKEKPPKPARKQDKKKDKESKTGVKKNTFAKIKPLILPALKAVRNLFRLLLKQLHFIHMQADVAVATGDAAQTATLYGKVSAAVYGALGVLRQFFHLHKPKILVFPDFSASKISVSADMTILTVPLGLIGGAIPIAFSFFMTLIRLGEPVNAKTSQEPTNGGN